THDSPAGRARYAAEQFSLLRSACSYLRRHLTDLEFGWSKNLCHSIYSFPWSRSTCQRGAITFPDYLYFRRHFYGSVWLWRFASRGLDRVFREYPAHGGGRVRRLVSGSAGVDKSKSIRIGVLHRASIRRREPGGVLAWRVHKFLHARQDETLDEWQMALDAHGWI